MLQLFSIVACCLKLTHSYLEKKRQKPKAEVWRDTKHYLLRPDHLAYFLFKSVWIAMSTWPLQLDHPKEMIVNDFRSLAANIVGFDRG